VHIHASFELETNRRSIIQSNSETKGLNAVKASWNKLLLTKMIPQAYFDLVKTILSLPNFQSQEKGRLAVKLFPTNSNKPWEAILEPTVELLAQLEVFPLFSSEALSKLDPDLLFPPMELNDPDDSHSDQLFSLLSHYGFRVAKVPKRLAETLHHLGYLLDRILDPSKARKKLQGISTPQPSLQGGALLLTFLLSDKPSWSELDSIYLLPTDDGSFAQFEGSSSPIKRYFFVGEEESFFVHPSSRPTLVNRDPIFKILHQHFLTASEGSVNIIRTDGKFFEEQFKRFFQFHDQKYVAWNDLSEEIKELHPRWVDFLLEKRFDFQNSACFHPANRGSRTYLVHPGRVLVLKKSANTSSSLIATLEKLSPLFFLQSSTETTFVAPELSPRSFFDCLDPVSGYSPHASLNEEDSSLLRSFILDSNEPLPESAKVMDLPIFFSGTGRFVSGKEGIATERHCFLQNKRYNCKLDDLIMYSTEDNTADREMLLLQSQRKHLLSAVESAVFIVEKNHAPDLLIEQPEMIFEVLAGCSRFSQYYESYKAALKNNRWVPSFQGPVLPSQVFLPEEKFDQATHRWIKKLFPEVRFSLFTTFLSIFLLF